jgi:hypothetical protein
VWAPVKQWAKMFEGQTLLLVARVVPICRPMLIQFDARMSIVALCAQEKHFRFSHSSFRLFAS